MSHPGRSAIFLATIPALLALAGCGSSKEEAPSYPAGNDPALTGALADQIMVDPDLAGQNEAAAGVRISATDRALPTENNSPEEIAAARRAALKLVGGEDNMKQPPAARKVAGKIPEAAAFTAAARAAASSKRGAQCADKVSYTMTWAAKLPATFPVYPRGNVQEAAGTDEGGCALRVVSFTTPVGLQDVMAFYYTRGIRAGYKVDRFLQDGEDMLGGTKGPSSYMVYARSLPSGRTEVDLVTSG
ncbi:hypothetical protein MB02_05820 [Croceicoccus estronivorus]|uniref:hypothetical protein n=1 Tax=Croceicoccus estronivorus TaxID=1172626 RepID=UPI000830A5BC|nr:hypothetical protein [Croceicoccus estronivorus]OCC24958.1 hypothetical protein MB02_05820 [Croceicoccus estronivorus]